MKRNDGKQIVIAETTLQQFQNLPDDIKLVVVHPWALEGAYHILHNLEEQGQLMLINCARLRPTLDDLLSEIEYTLGGASLPRDPAASGEALAQQLVALNKTLVLEGYDVFDGLRRPAGKRSKKKPTDQVSPVDAFVIALLEGLTPAQRVLILSRTVPMPAFQQPDACTMLPQVTQNMYLDYSRANSISEDGKPTIILEVRALGAGHAIINGRYLDQWEGTLPKSLFFYFVDRGMTTRDNIFETFWNTLETKEATNVFHVTKRKIFEILDADLTAYGSGFYRIADHIELHYDVEKLLWAVSEAAVTANEAEAIDLYNRAINLYRGAFLSIHEQDWIKERREELEFTYSEALAGLGRIYQDRQEWERALGLYMSAVAHTPQREDLVRDIMHIYANQLNQPEEALYIYQIFEKRLAADLNVEPSPETYMLMEDIRRKID